MAVIHYRKTATGTETWCGAQRPTPWCGEMREPDNTSPSQKEVTCKRCLAAADKWLRQHKANQRREQRRKEETQNMSFQQRQIHDEMMEASRKAVDSLARYKFAMFGYWAGIYIHLHRLSGETLPNPFSKLVKLAREMRDNGDV